MKKKTMIKLCNIASLILLLCFVISTMTGYLRYSSTLNSAPFSVWVLADALYFIAPSLILFIVSIVLQKKVIIRSAAFWSYIVGLVVCSLTAVLLIWNPFKKEALIPLGNNLQRIYVYRDSPEPEFMSPSITLDEVSKRFQFTYSVLSSYIPTGYYEIKDEELILTTSDCEYEYVFDITDEGYVFNEEKSSKIPKYRYEADGKPESPVPDGALFR